VGKIVNPKTSQKRAFYVVANSATTITVWGDAGTTSQLGSVSGAPWQVIDFHLPNGSAGEDVGSTTVPGLPANDIDGDLRPGPDALVDIGCDEIACLAAGSTAVSQTAGTNPSCAGASITLEAAAGYPSYLWSNGAATQSITVAPTTTTTYSARGVDGSACTTVPTFWTQNVTASLSAVGIAASGATSICRDGSGATYTVTPTGGGTTSYQWGYRTVSNGAITPIPGQTGATYVLNGAHLPSAGNFFIVCTATPTCGSAMISNQLSISVTANPAFGGSLSIADSSCGIRVNWPAATFASGNGHYDLYRTIYTGTQTCADALAAPPIAANITGNFWDDGTTVPGSSYLYVLRAEDATAGPGTCSTGAHGGIYTDSTCLGPTNDATQGTEIIPLDLDDQLRVAKAPASTDPLLDWTSHTAGNTTTHYHVYRATSSAAAFGTWTQLAPHAPPLTAKQFTDATAAGSVYFYDVRSADACENISPSSLRASASSSSPSCNASGSITFGASVANGVPPYFYDWDFGDLSPHATTPNPTHVYSYSPYQRTVVLTVEDSTVTGGPDGQIRMLTLQVGFGPGGVGVSAGSSSPDPLGTPTEFTASASGGSGTYTYEWSFGDGTTSTAQNPTHTYAAAGSHTAVVVVKDEAGCSAQASLMVTIQ
jgi:hypothetical protein